jgi:hypothetical protein
MTDRGRLIGGVVIATVIVIGVLAAVNTRRPARTSDSSPEPSVVASIGDAASATPGLATPGAVATAEATEAPLTPTPTPDATPKAQSIGDPGLAYAEFLLRANDDRSTTEMMNAALTKGVNDRDRDAVRKTSVEILDFVDSERGWLREHPPANCYADAHEAADSMLAAYGTAADRFIAWTKAAPGLDSLGAFARALEAANTAGDALAAFGRALESTSCP